MDKLTKGQRKKTRKLLSFFGNEIDKKITKLRGQSRECNRWK